MTFQETVDFLYSKLPYFTRDGKAAIKKDLTNTILLCEALGNPQNKFKCIHIAGTNGKGSVSNMLSAILQSHGYKTGLYTSPHLKDCRERIRVDGEMVTEEFVINFTNKIKPLIVSIQPSFFEITVALCFDYFAQSKVEYAVIETGLGGRLDSTNIITPILSVITNIGKDHADLLGDTLAKIAFEKAGIIKNGVPVVIGESHIETDSVFISKARETDSTLYFADTNVCYYNTEIETDLLGEYQQKNAVTVMQAVDILKQKGINLDSFKIAQALQNVRSITQFRGRWEILNKHPKIIADTGHNTHGLRLVMQQLKKEKFNQLHIVFGMVSDKARTELLELLPKDAIYYFTKANLPRSLAPEILMNEGLIVGLKGTCFQSVKEAIESAKNNASSDDLIFIGGSTFVVAEAI
ncbi:MAG: bifunctional folylpolyglutamate synthase/dihydrofolate synthase [Bacteroidia bacterium]|nr:bifunctional folylpolyglutamate synthase/dihydrofolate synthase [Bacteroidia bacterium]